MISVCIDSEDLCEQLTYSRSYRTKDEEQNVYTKTNNFRLHSLSRLPKSGQIEQINVEIMNGCVVDIYTLRNYIYILRNYLAYFRNKLSYWIEVHCQGSSEGAGNWGTCQGPQAKGGPQIKDKANFT